MPGWEKIEFKERILKRKETYNQFGKKIRFEPLQSIPKLRKLSSYNEEYGVSRETLKWRERIDISEKTNEFVNLAQSKGFNEEQALHILNYHNFDRDLALCDLDIYRPLKGMKSDNDKGKIALIVDDICARIECGKNRDLNMALIQFPAHPIGDLLDFYANNRLYIKKKLYKKKSKNLAVAKNIFSDFLENVDFTKCGSILRSNYLRKTSKEKISIPEILATEARSLGKPIFGHGSSWLGDIPVEEVLGMIKKREAISPTEDDDNEYLLRDLESLYDKLDDIGVWMGEGGGEEVVRHHWDNMDLSLLLLGLRRFGPNFDELCRVIVTKSPAMIESFYLSFKDKYGLDQIEIDISQDQ